MRYILLPLLFVFLQTTSCGNDDTESIAENEANVFDVEQLTGVQHDIAVNILSSKFGGYRKDQPNTRALSQFSLTPYVADGDTVMFIAQYADGWEIYSANKAANMVLFSSNQGKFDINDPEMPDGLRYLISSNASAIGDIPDSIDNNIDRSWGAFALTDEELKKGEITELTADGNRRKVASQDLPPGYWIVLECTELRNETHVSPKIVNTKWGQLYPWNSYIKLLYNQKEQKYENAPAGCTTIALAQYMYHTHYKEGVPLTAMTVASLATNKVEYNFSSPSTNVWDSMSRTFDSENSRDAAAVFIGSVAKQLNNEYTLNGTSHSTREIAPFLNSVYKGSTFNLEDFNFAYIENSIDEGLPVIGSARTNKMETGESISQKGHTFLIDRYSKTYKTYRYVYALVRTPLKPGEIDRWMVDFIDQDGNVIKYAYTNVVTEDRVENLGISMNWGESGGYYDNILYSPYSSWNLGGYSFNLMHQIVTRRNN